MRLSDCLESRIIGKFDWKFRKNPAFWKFTGFRVYCYEEIAALAE